MIRLWEIDNKLLELKSHNDIQYLRNNKACTFVFVEE